jgi:hypothetical protein
MSVDPEHGQLHCIDARSDGKILRHLQTEGLNIDEGLVVMRDSEYLHGAEAMYSLARVTQKHGIFNRTYRVFFGSRQRARRWYPIFTSARQGLLLLLRRQNIAAGDVAE